ncbi:MAG: hypothetical protein IKZ13_03255 [Akkermansia sp.]|nr:hypothetical protein [Akkermansia sp.]
MKSRVVPQKLVRQFSPAVREPFRRWAEYMYEQVPFLMPDSIFHAHAHCERVLLYALLLSEKMLPGDDAAMTVLAHAAVFHDTRRENDGRDVGHGARAADFYEMFCREHPELTYLPEAACIMRWHDRDDSQGQAAIDTGFAEQAGRVRQLFAVFKDADALDRWRLGRRGLDINRLRSDEAAQLAGFSRTLVEMTS